MSLFPSVKRAFTLALGALALRTVWRALRRREPPLRVAREVDGLRQLSRKRRD